MDSTLTRFVIGALAVLGVIGLSTAIGFAVAAYQSWVRKTRGPEEAEEALSGGPCSRCVVSGNEGESCPAGVVERPDVEGPAKSDPDS